MAVEQDVLECVLTDDPALTLWGRWQGREFRAREVRLVLEEPISLDLGDDRRRLHVDLDLTISEVDAEEDDEEMEGEDDASLEED
jgi:hypothetical protein